MFCYQCEEQCNYLFADGRCGHCTRLTPGEVTGETSMDEDGDEDE